MLDNTILIVPFMNELFYCLLRVKLRVNKFGFNSKVISHKFLQSHLCTVATLAFVSLVCTRGGGRGASRIKRMGVLVRNL